jgi:hypothetical protein
LASALNPALSPNDDDPESPRIAWAELRVQDLTTTRITLCRLDVCFPEPPDEGDENYYPRLLSFTSKGVLALESPSGERLRLSLPLPASIDVAPPS